MKTKLILPLSLLLFAVCAPVFSQNPNPPEVFDVSKAKIQIVGATFVTKLDTPQSHFEETKPDKYHGLIVTLKVTKATSSELTLTCQDITLHYRYGQEYDAARCYGLSSYSVTPSEDRPMSLYKEGWGRATTGLATTKSDTVYVDVFFQNMEPDTSDLYIFIAQPTGSHFVSSGWK